MVTHDAAAVSIALTTLSLPLMAPFFEDLGIPDEIRKNPEALLELSFEKLRLVLVGGEAPEHGASPSQKTMRLDEYFAEISRSYGLSQSEKLQRWYADFAVDVRKRSARAKWPHLIGRLCGFRRHEFLVALANDSALVERVCAAINPAQIDRSLRTLEDRLKGLQGTLRSERDEQVQRIVATAAGTGSAATALEIAGNFVIEVREARFGLAILETLDSLLNRAQYERLLRWADEYRQEIQ